MEGLAPCLTFNHWFTVIGSLTADMRPLSTPDQREVTSYHSDVSGTRDEVGRTRLRDWFDRPMRWNQTGPWERGWCAKGWMGRLGSIIPFLRIAECQNPEMPWDWPLILLPLRPVRSREIEWLAQGPPVTDLSQGGWKPKVNSVFFQAHIDLKLRCYSL